MAEKSQSSEQTQQSGESQRAPTAAHEGEAVRIERPVAKGERRAFTDWASI